MRGLTEAFVAIGLAVVFYGVCAAGVITVTVYTMRALGVLPG